jgi:uncharacterized protein involved in exopolysaccharide biosynthesis
MKSIEYESMSFKDFFHTIFKRKFLILLFFLGTFCTVTICTFLIKPTYEAKAQILVKLGRQSVYVPEIGTTTPMVNINRKEQINSEVEILKSTSLIQEVVNFLRPLNIYPKLGESPKGIVVSILHRIRKPQDPVKEAFLTFQNNLKIEAVPDSNIIELKFRHTDPKMAATALNTLADKYLEHHLNVHKAKRTHIFFQQQAEYLRNKVDQGLILLQNLKEKHNITSFEEQQNLLLTRISELGAELDHTKSQIRETQNRIAYIQKKLTETPKIDPKEGVDPNRVLINTLEAQLIELRLRKEQLLMKYTEKSRLVKNVNQEIKIINQKLAEKEAKGYGQIDQKINDYYQHLTQQLHGYEADLKSLEAKINAQRTVLQEYHQKLAHLNRIAADYNQLQQNLEFDQKNFNLYLTKFEESRINDAMDAEKITSVTLVEKAQVPINAISPRKLLNIVLGFLLGALGSLGLAFFLDYLDDSLETVESVENCLELPVLISIPFTPKLQT